MPCGPSTTGGTTGGASVPPGSSSNSDIGGVTNHSSPTTVTSPGSLTTNGTSISVISSPTGFSDQASRPTVSVSSRPPLPLPPRHCVHGQAFIGTASTRNGALTCNNGEVGSPDQGRPWWRSWNRKYVLLCGTCGLSSVLLGIFYLVIYFVLRSYTSSLEFFQTMPTYIPACMLIVTGILVLCFMRRNNRLSVLIKIVGVLCLVCAVVCVVVTVTTTVLHMNRLQTLRECTFYTQLHSCTCLPFTEEEPFELKLDIHITTCDVIHGALYSCLRAMFGVSVIGILVSIFSCMLVYQLLSHEKKKMYWEQLENRRRLLYRRAPPSGGASNCCDEYGFVPSAELYPWGMWDTVDERYWGSGAQLYSPGGGGEDSSNASRSVLLGGANPNGAPALWLPWGGAWGATEVPSHPQGTLREAITPAESSGQQASSDNIEHDDSHPQTTGMLLRPFLPGGLEARFGLRRQPPPTHGTHSRRPLSDPGVTLQLPRYPPPFSEAYIPPLGYEGLDALSRLMWDPPPPYSQPASAENLNTLSNIPTSPSSPPHDIHDVHRALSILSTPSRRPAALCNLMREANNPYTNRISSPCDGTEMPVSPGHYPLAKLETIGVMGDTGSLPLSHRLRRLPLGHVKSLGDVTEATTEDLEVLFCNGKQITALDKFSTHNDILQKFPSHGDVTQRLLALKSRHLKSVSDPRCVYGKAEQESELYFADVSSCVSVRADHDDCDDPMYYSESTIQKAMLSSDNKEEDTLVGVHLYEQVRHKEEDDEEEDAQSHHTSDDTMIIHTSSSDHSVGIDTENTYSIVSPLTDQSSASPMITDTDAYSCYQAVASLGSLRLQENVSASGNLNLHPCHQLQRVQPMHFHHFSPKHTTFNPSLYNDNDCMVNSSTTKVEPRYEIMPGEEKVESSTSSVFMAPSDMNGNVALATGQREAPVVKQAQRTNLTLPLKKMLPTSGIEHKLPEADRASAAHGRRPNSAKTHKKQISENSKAPYHSSEPNTPTDRRIQSLQDHLFTLKSVNV